MVLYEREIITDGLSLVSATKQNVGSHKFKMVAAVATPWMTVGREQRNLVTGCAKLHQLQGGTMWRCGVVKGQSDL
jgi:hypothetical protein